VSSPRKAIGSSSSLLEQVDAAVVVVDQAPQLDRDRFGDRPDVVQAIELGRQALEQAQVCH
jgi:hypothetical protein